VFSRRGVIVNANPGLARILDRPLDQIIGFPIVSFVHEEDRPRVLLQLDQFVVGSYEHRLVTSTGKIVPVEATATLVPAKSGPPVRFTVLRDIADRVTIENNLDRQRRLLEAILEEMPVGVFVAEAPSCAPILINP